VDRRPRVLDILVERLRAIVDPGEHPRLLRVLDLEVEAVGVALQAKRL
jgi:energy-converting hydrogenase Eha subunit E